MRGVVVPEKFDCEEIRCWLDQAAEFDMAKHPLGYT